MNAGALLLGILLLLCLPLLGCYLGRRFNRHIPDEMSFGFWRSYLFCLSMHMYACLLTGAAEYVYFKYMDGGALLDTFYNVLNNPATTEAYRSMGMENSITMLRETLDLLAGLSVFDITLALFNQNVMFSLLLALPTALFVRK